MTLTNFLKNTVLRMDLLSASPTFRVRKESQYESIVGGFLSFVIMLIFSLIFGLQLKNMFSYLSISYSQGLSDDISSTDSISDIRFAVSIENVDLSVTPRQFMFFLDQISIAPVNGTPTLIRTPVMLSPCQYSDWSDLGTNFQKQYTAFGFGKMLCLDSSATYDIMGYIGSPDYKYLTFQIQMCNQTIDSHCDSPGNIASAMTAHISNHDYYKVRFFVVDTIITADNQDAITKILQKNIFLAFTNTIGTVGYVNMAQYTLQTDESPWPVTEYSEDTGSFIQGFQTNSVSISSTKYVSLDIYKSTKSLTVTRTIGKIDEVLSYVGGLFGLMFTGIAFFVASYSQYCYQLYVAESMLTVDEKGKKVKQKQFGFLTYLSYSIYDWMDTFHIAPKCLKKLSEIHEIREQVCEQLDPVIILKRIKYLQDVSKVLLSEHKQMCCYLSEPITLQQARRMRNTLMFYDKVMEQMHQNQNKQANANQNRIDAADKYLIYPSNAIDNSQKLQQSNEGKVIQMDSEQLQQQGEQITQQEEEQMLFKIMLEAVQKLQSDQSDIAKRIKTRVTAKTRAIIKNNKLSEQNSNSNPNDLISPMSPNMDRNDSQIQLTVGNKTNKLSKINIKKARN